MKVTAPAVLLLSAALLLPASGQAQSTSFESGLGSYSFSGSGPYGTSTSLSGVTAQHGSWFAHVGGPAGRLTSGLFSAAAGSTLSFWVNAIFVDYLPYDDYVFAELLVAGSPFATLYQKTLSEVCGDACSGSQASGWQQVTHTFASAGTYQLRFGAQDVIDGGWNPTLAIDNIETGTSVTPEPVSMALLGTGLAGLGAVRRRRRKESETA